MTSDTISYPARQRSLSRPRFGALLRQRPELLGLLGVAAVLNLWGLSINGWANTYYSAAVRSMSTSWHDFLFASLDRSGLMTVDKPPLALWVQALSARVFGFHPLSILVPQALMGVVAVGLVYDLTRRRFGRPAGFVAGLALATTPVIVAVSRHNNPDELLVLCSVAAIWFAVRALETGRTRWLVLSGVAVGLGFETKMGVALMVVPGIAAAWMWIAPAARGRLHALRQLLAGGAAMVAVGLAWPVLVTLTPAADRPWISGTSDNSIWSLIFGYNGFGRLDGQTGGPGGGGGGGGMFGGATGPFRLLQSSLGDQAGWLLGFAVVAALVLLVVTRLRRDDARTGWLLVVGGAFATTAVAFSYASGIFHPYYVSMLAPFAAALIGAGVGMMLDGPSARVIAPLAIVAGAITELVVLGELGDSWPGPSRCVIVLGVGAAIALALRLSPRVRMVLVAVAVAALFAAPATWAAETLGHATSATFPTGGPANAVSSGLWRPGRPRRIRRPRRVRREGRVWRGSIRYAARDAGRRRLRASFGQRGDRLRASVQRRRAGRLHGPDRGRRLRRRRRVRRRHRNPHGGDRLRQGPRWRHDRRLQPEQRRGRDPVERRGDVAGLGGFSGRESSVSVKWLASEVAAGRLRWVIVDSTQGGGGLPGDTRTGSQTAMAAVAKSCKAVTLKTSNGTATMYDCSGRAAAILAAAGSGGN